MSCPSDGAVLQEIGVVTGEQMDTIPQQLRVILHERVKYACPCCDGGLRLAAKPDHVLYAPLIYGGETEIHVLKEAGRTAQSKSYMWA